MTVRRVAAAGAVLTVALGLAVTLQAGPAAGSAVQSQRVIGYSVEHRPIVAYRLGNPAASTKVVLLGQMHGDEHAGVILARSLVTGTQSVEGLDLWVVPTLNPDGDARHTRQNAHHVDLNRNWPDHWVHLTGRYYAGRSALSEPETRAMYTFLRTVRPRYVISLHQPLYGVDTTDGGALDHGLRDRLASNLHLPRKAFRCWGFCHGSMTGWYTTHRYGIADTVEFGAHPSAAYLTGTAKRGIVAALGGSFGTIAAHNPHTSLTVSTTPGTATLSGWAYDPDTPGTALPYTVTRDGTAVLTTTTARSSLTLNRAHGLTGSHAFADTLATRPGRHRFCISTANRGVGDATATRCVDVAVAVPSRPAPRPPNSTAPTPR